MKRINKGQTAMEWVILVILIAIGFLAYFGVLNPDRISPPDEEIKIAICYSRFGASSLFITSNIMSTIKWYSKEYEYYRENYNINYFFVEPTYRFKDNIFEKQEFTASILEGYCEIYYLDLETMELIKEVK